MTSSEIIDFEISRTPDPDRRMKVLTLLKLAIEPIKINAKIINRAKTFQKYEIKSIDALHLACAEQGNVNVFLTTDELLLKKYNQKRDEIHVQVSNPLTWLMEVL